MLCFGKHGVQMQNSKTIVQEILWTKTPPLTTVESSFLYIPKNKLVSRHLVIIDTCALRAF